MATLKQVIGELSSSLITTVDGRETPELKTAAISVILDMAPLFKATMGSDVPADVKTIKAAGLAKAYLVDLAFDGVSANFAVVNAVKAAHSIDAAMAAKVAAIKAQSAEA